MTSVPALGRVGVFAFSVALGPSEDVKDAVARLEELGYGAVWYPEIPAGREALATAALLLGWSERIVVASGIASIYARDATATANGARTLDDAYPGRFLLGVGVSHAPSVAHRGSTYGRPVATMRSYLDAMDDTKCRIGDEAPPRVLAALGPRMLDLAAERSLGAHPYFVPVEHTAFARDRLGAQALLAPEQAVVLETSPERARAIAREHTKGYLGLENYRNNLRRFGFEDEEMEGGGSDRLVDAIVAWGSLDDIRSRVEAHFAAGADHVAIQAIGTSRAQLPLDQLAELAPALLDL